MRVREVSGVEQQPTAAAAGELRRLAGPRAPRKDAVLGAASLRFDESVSKNR